ncbi:MAG: hypothetical protein ACYDEY_07450 [Acidimicrobiales bacterium]
MSALTSLMVANCGPPLMLADANGLLARVIDVLSCGAVGQSRDIALQAPINLTANQPFAWRCLNNDLVVLGRSLSGTFWVEFQGELVLARAARMISPPGA